MADRRFFVKIIEEVVGEVQQLWQTELPEEEREEPFYDFGHPAEIAHRLNEKEEDTYKFKKYPLIVLLTDFEEKPGGDLYFYHVPCTILICTETDPNLTGRQQMDLNYEPILQPLYELFLQALVDSQDIVEVYEDEIRPTKINRLHWGKEGQYASEGLIFNDTIDVIQLNFEMIKVKFVEDC